MGVCNSACICDPLLGEDLTAFFCNIQGQFSHSLRIFWLATCYGKERKHYLFSFLYTSFSVTYPNISLHILYWLGFTFFHIANKFLIIQAWSKLACIPGNDSSRCNCGHEWRITNNRAKALYQQRAGPDTTISYCQYAMQHSTVHWSGSIASHKYKHIWKTNIFVDSISEFEYNWFCLQQDYKQWTLYILRVHEFCDEVGKHCRIVLSGGDAGQNWMNTCYNSTEGSLHYERTWNWSLHLSPTHADFCQPQN